jgi:microcystin-dependent protein
MIEGTIGEIRLFSGSFAPEGWAWCDGQTMRIRENTALWSIIGTRYGGQEPETFQLPHLAPLMESDGGETPIRYVICLNGYYPSRS